MYPLFETEVPIEKSEGLFKEHSRHLRQLLQDSTVLGELEKVILPTHSSLRACLSLSQIPLILLEGALCVEVDQKRVLILEEGDALCSMYKHENPLLDLSSEFSVSVGCVSVEQWRTLSQSAPVAECLIQLSENSNQYLLSLLSGSNLLGSEYAPAVRALEKREVLIQEGDLSEEVYTLAEGVLEVLVEGVQVGEIYEGEIFGVIAAFTGTPRTATVRAQTPCSVLKLPKHQFKDLIRANPSTVTTLVEGMSRAIVEMNNRFVLQEKGGAGDS